MEGVAKDLVANSPEATVSFFAVFSRFEYALKRRAEADWTRFANGLGKPFFDEVLRSERATVLIHQPPKKQINEKGQLTWQDATEINNVTELFKAVCLVRNNLFHGGKYPQAPIDDRSRNQELLLQAKFVLERALERCPTVKEFFEVGF